MFENPILIHERAAFRTQSYDWNLDIPRPKVMKGRGVIALGGQHVSQMFRNDGIVTQAQKFKTRLARIMNISHNWNPMSSRKMGGLLGRLVPASIDQQNLGLFDAIQVQVFQVHEQVLLGINHKRAFAVRSLHHYKTDPRLAVWHDVHLGSSHAAGLEFFKNCAPVSATPDASQQLCRTPQPFPATQSGRTHSSPLNLILRAVNNSFAAWELWNSH